MRCSISSLSKRRSESTDASNSESAVRGAAAALGFAAVPIFCTVSRTPRSSAKIVSSFGSLAVVVAGAPVGRCGGKLSGFAAACSPGGGAATGTGVGVFYGSLAVAVAGAPVGRCGAKLCGLAAACSPGGDAAGVSRIAVLAGSILGRVIVRRCLFDFGSFDSMFLSDAATRPSVFEVLIAISPSVKRRAPGDVTLHKSQLFKSPIDTCSWKAMVAPLQRIFRWHHSSP
jgi:hypothetical protein